MSPRHDFCRICGTVLGANTFRKSGLADYQGCDITQEELDWCNPFVAIMYEVVKEDPKKFLAPYLSGHATMKSGYHSELTAPFGDRPEVYRIQSGAEIEIDNAIIFASYGDRVILVHGDIDLTIGYVVHAKCWEALERKIGPMLRQNLNLIVESIEAVVTRHAYLGAEACQHRHYWVDNGSVLYVRDPFLFPFHATAMGKEDFPHNLLAQLPSATAKQVPLEIETMIWRQMSFPDLSNFCTALNQGIPHYWCREIVSSNWKLFLDASETQANNLDWRSLCEVLGRRNPPPGLLNRDRVFRLLEFIKEEFNRLKKEGQSGESVPRRLLEH
ncbi:MAG: hypothetical protein M1835_001445 [Candelina submexicana]|nr:MAG: hypothetical protein M1835_001445 [Candelina submexicana]